MNRAKGFKRLTSDEVNTVLNKNVSSGDKWLLLLILSLHLVFILSFFLIIKQISTVSVLIAMMLIFSCALLRGKWAGLLSGLAIGAAQVAVLALASPRGFGSDAYLLQPEALVNLLLPLIGLLAGITAEKFGVRNHRLVTQAITLDQSNATLQHNLERYEQVFQGLSQNKVYPRFWDDWATKDALHEQVAGVLFSTAIAPVQKGAGLFTSDRSAPVSNILCLIFAMRPEILAVMDLTGKITCTNPMLLALFAMDTSRKLEGTNLLELLLPDDAKRAAANMAKAVKASLDTKDKYRIRTSDGGFSSLLISPEIRLESIGSPMALIAVADRTEIRKNQYDPFTSDETAPDETIASLVHRHMICLSPAGIIHYVDAGTADFIGETQTKLLHGKFEKFVSKKETWHYREFFDNCRSGHRITADIEMLPHNGERIFFRLEAYPTMGQSGKLLGIPILIENITAVKLVEEALQHRLSLEKLISSISTRFISIQVDELDQEIQQVLQKICEVEELEESTVEIVPSSRIKNHVKFHVTRSAPYAKHNKGSDDRMETIAIPIVIDFEKMGFFQFGQKQFSNNWMETDLELIRLIGEIIINALIRKENELSILLNETRLSTTLLSIGDAVIATDLDGKIVLMNKMAETLTGWTKEEALHQHYKNVFNPYFAEKPDGADVDNPPHTMPDTPDSLMLQSRDGQSYFISINQNPIEDPYKEVYGEVFVFRDITREKLENDEIRYISFHDKLTGLFNRAYFEEEMIRLNTTRQYPITILLGDCNGLKIANDIFGHLEGDKLLQTIAKIMKKATRHEDIVARWGGDEFAVILPRTDEQAAGPIRERILQLCEEAESDPLRPSLALGSATNMDGSSDLVALLKLAEDRMYRHKLTEGKSARNSILLSIEKMLYEKSCETEEHANRMADVSHKIGQAIGLNDYELEELSLLSKLHDMGKIGIPDSILLKPDKLSDAEWDLMKKHSEKGYELAKSTPELNNIADLILHHHERWDGTGYPSGLAGENIPKLSRVLSIIDAYDVITHSRSYKPVQSKQDALREIENCAGKQFDPEISRVFIDIMKE